MIWFQGQKYICISTMPEHRPRLNVFSLHWSGKAATPNPEYWAVSHQRLVKQEECMEAQEWFPSPLTCSRSSLLNDIVTMQLRVFVWEEIQSLGHYKALRGRVKMTKAISVALADGEWECNAQKWTFILAISVQPCGYFRPTTRYKQCLHCGQVWSSGVCLESVFDL